MRHAYARSFLLTALALLLVLPGFAALRGSEPHAAPAAPALTTDAVALPPGVEGRALAPATMLSTTFTLPYANSGALNALLANLQNPTSPEYRHFLTAPQFREDFSPSEGAVQTVEQVLRNYGAVGLAVGPGGATISARLPASGLDSLLGVQLVEIGSVGRAPVYTAQGTPELPSALQGLVSGVGGLSDAANLHLVLATPLSAPQLVRAPAGHPSDFVLGGTPPRQWFIGSDFTQAYQATALFPGGAIGGAGRYPTNIAIATLLASAYNATTGDDLPPWDPNVIDTYFNNTSAPAWPHSPITGVPVTVDGITPLPPGFFGAANDTSGFEFENSLDLEMAGSLAPGAPLYNFYFAGSIAATATTDQLSSLADDFSADLSAALNYAYPSGVRLGVVSASFGLPDLNDSSWNSALAEAAATGVTVVSASGDQGNAPPNDTGRGPDGQWPTWPATAAFNTTGTLAVGGVDLTLDGVPTTTFNGTSLNVTYDSNQTGISGMSTWYDTSAQPGSGSWAGSEGGLSTVIPEPTWQFHSAAQPAISAAGGLQGASLLGRAEPDVAFPANNTVAYVLADDQGNLYFDLLGGTSIAAPVFAGLLADEESVIGTPLGYLAPTLYRMASYYQAFPSSSNPFLDVTVGGNYVFHAGLGWDATTGWGGLTAGLFYRALQNSTVTGYVYTGPTPGLPPPAAPPGFPVLGVIVIVILAVAAAVALVVAFGRPRHPGPPPSAPWGPTGGMQPPAQWPPGAYPGGPPPPPPSAPPGAVGAGAPTFLCPYCGSPRPAEPVRCPRCGTL